MGSPGRGRGRVRTSGVESVGTGHLVCHLVCDLNLRSVERVQ